MQNNIKISIYGNHSSCHCGSRAVWRRINQLVRESGAEILHHEDVEKSDCLIINGEGTMHDDHARAINKLRFGKKSKKRGRQVHFINSVWQNMTAPEVEFIKEFDSVFVRELFSYNEIKSIRPDTKVATDLSYDLPVKLPKGKRDRKVVGGFFSNQMNRLRELMFPKSKYLEINIKKYSTWEEYLEALSIASMLISGYHHEIIAACKLRIPFVAYRGNTDKVLGIIQRAKASIPVASTPEELEFNIDNMPDAKEYDKLFDFLESQKAFTLKDLGL